MKYSLLDFRTGFRKMSVNCGSKLPIPSATAGDVEINYHDPIKKYMQTDVRSVLSHLFYQNNYANFNENLQGNLNKKTYE